jgi:hypothetical protein
MFIIKLIDRIKGTRVNSDTEKHWIASKQEIKSIFISYFWFLKLNLFVIQVVDWEEPQKWSDGGVKSLWKWSHLLSNILL